MPGCAFTPAAKWCLTSVISVTRSAAASSSGLALRPVTTTCRSLAARTERGDHGVEVEIVVAQRDIELVENDELEARIVHQFARFRPSALGRGDIAGAILRFPGETLAHRVPDDLIAELRQRVALGGVPGAL